MYQYANIRNFDGGKTDEKSALAQCLTTSIDQKFQFGSARSAHIGARSMECQHFMAERCAKNWDDYCEYYYRHNGEGGEWPNNKRWPNTFNRPWEKDVGVSQYLTLGDQLLRNTGEVKYCKLKNCTAVKQPFDPTDPNTPMITTYQSYDGCIPVCKVDPSTIDNDPVMDKMIANPKASAATLINICNTSKRYNINLNGTKLGKVCHSYFSNL